MPWWMWLIGALALIGAEIFTGGFGVLWFGIAALAAALLSSLGVGLTGQLVVFALGGLILLAATRPLVRRLKAREVPTNVEAMVGQVGVVEQPLGDVGAPAGYVRVGSDLWRATADRPLPAGTRVVVREVRGVTLVVAPAEVETETREA